RRPASTPGRAEGNALSHYRRVRARVAMLILRPGDCLRAIGCPACSLDSAARPPTAAQGAVPGARGGCAALAATRAPGHEPHGDEYGHRDPPDGNKRLERSQEP